MLFVASVHFYDIFLQLILLLLVSLITVRYSLHRSGST